MKRIHALVEGFSEEAFIKRTLAPYLQTREIFLNPVLLYTKVNPDGSREKGGGVSYARIKKQILSLLGDSSANAVTTMLDFYALPLDFPRSAGGSSSSFERAMLDEREFGTSVSSARFIPYLSIHEFEALVLTDPLVIQKTVGSSVAPVDLISARSSHNSPEHIDSGRATSPSHRILAQYPSYMKAIDGPIVADEIGIDRIKSACVHFSTWIDAMCAC